MQYMSTFFGVGTIRATIIIETLTAAVNIEDMMYELKEYCCGANAGRWDYIFSIIKCLQGKTTAVLPDRKQVKLRSMRVWSSEVNTTVVFSSLV